MDWPTHKESRLARNCGFIFIACCVLSLATQTYWWIFPAIPCWVIAAIAESRRRREFARELDIFREANKSKHAEVFSNPPPTGLDEVADSSVDLYDSVSCTYLGLVPAHDLQVIVGSYADVPDLLPNGDNDIPFSIDDLQAIPEIYNHSFSDEFVETVQPIFDRDYQFVLTLRWTKVARTV